MYKPWVIMASVSYSNICLVQGIFNEIDAKFYKLNIKVLRYCLFECSFECFDLITYASKRRNKNVKSLNN